MRKQFVSSLVSTYCLLGTMNEDESTQSLSDKVLTVPMF